MVKDWAESEGGQKKEKAAQHKRKGRLEKLLTVN